MKEFESLNVPQTDPVPEEGAYAIQDWECKNISDYSDCANMINCDACIFYKDNIDKFKKWYSQKAL